MKPRGRPITSLRVKNFKAIKDTGTLAPGGLTVFIGDNGTGKSSVLEALRFVCDLSHETLDRALDPFGGYEHVRWKGGLRRGHRGEEPWQEFHPIDIQVRGHVGRATASATTRISGQNQNVAVFEHEELRIGTERQKRDAKTRTDRSLLAQTGWFDDWQFLDMVPTLMGKPIRRGATGAAVRLAPDGSNLAEYLLDLQNVPGEGADAFQDLVERLKVILPYARDIEPIMSQMFERQVGFRLHEGSFTVPGWMLSTGTLRLVALLALLRHPRPPSLLCLEEVENGLDPRTIHLVVEEIRSATDAGRTQIMLTTHSPYLLDLVTLDDLVLVTRDQGEPPRFDRPGEYEAVRDWARRFAPGQLYAMGTLHQRRDR
jgi:predicted ATPase